MYVIKNIRNHTVTVDQVFIGAGTQLSLHTISPQMQAAIDSGDLILRSGDETPGERRANVDAIKPFKVGDPAIDGDGR